MCAKVLIKPHVTRCPKLSTG